MARTKLEALIPVKEQRPTTIKDRVKAIMAETDISDPREIAVIIMEDLADDELRDALREVLGGYIRVCFHGIQISHREGRANVLTPDQTTTAHPSRWDAISSALRKPVCPGGAWKALGDCVRDDILLLAGERRDLATKCSAVAAGYEDLAQRMSARRAEFVRDLPADEIPEVLR